MARYRYSYEGEIIDALRMEASPVEPGTEQRLRGLVGEAGLKFASEFGDLLPADKLKKCQSLGDRLVVIDPQTDGVFNETWPEGDNGEGILNSASSAGFGTTFFTGELTTLTFPQDGWRSLLPQVRNNLAKKFFSRRRARLWLERYTEQNTATHEGAHLLEARRLPQDFSESGASYYAHVLSSPIDGRRLNVPTEGDFYVELYARTIQRFGNSVHSVFFNDAAGKDARKAVFRCFRANLTYLASHPF